MMTGILKGESIKVKRPSRVFFSVPKGNKVRASVNLMEDVRKIVEI